MTIRFEARLYCDHCGTASVRDVTVLAPPQAAAVRRAAAAEGWTHEGGTVVRRRDLCPTCSAVPSVPTAKGVSA